MKFQFFHDEYLYEPCASRETRQWIKRGIKCTEFDFTDSIQFRILQKSFVGGTKGKIPGQKHTDKILNFPGLLPTHAILGRVFETRVPPETRQWIERV